MTAVDALRWRAFCDAWLAIGVAAAWIDQSARELAMDYPRAEQLQRDALSWLMGRVVAKELPWQCRSCWGRTEWLAGSGTAVYWAKCQACRGTGRR